jgi:hypothetical protein
MNQAVHQLLQIILQAITWVLKTIEELWVWSWSQISSAFSMSWQNLPPWKLAVAIIAMATLAAILLILFKRGLDAFGKIAAAFWTMALTCFGIAAFVVVAGILSRGVQWVVATVPDNFWEKFLTHAS